MRNGIKWLINLWGVKKAKDANKAWSEVFNINNHNVKIVLKDLATYCNAYTTSFYDKDPYKTVFNEGARDVFLHILEMVSLDFNDYALKENDFNLD